MIRVHHLNNSRSQRILWLLEELGLPYEVVCYERDPTTMLAPPALRAVHPLGKSPVLEEDGQVLAESGAILEHLAERHGTAAGLAPPAPDAPERARFLYWLHFAEGSAMTPLLLKLYASRMGPGGAPLTARADAQIAGHLDHMEAALAEAPYFGGAAFGAADVAMSFPAEASVARGGLGPDRPRLWDWLARMHARPAYARALERGGPYELLR